MMDRNSDAQKSLISYNPGMSLDHIMKSLTAHIHIIP